ncbi:isochorismate synthase 2, chloroplastic-like isoform X1 [Curcuma longa]|uniref:isochorismate synthase 2, chloroplastic-like isoform X1 n=1 Tax=Curcuma longa TaxID=136217 RepID=UPI003D9F5D49
MAAAIRSTGQIPLPSIRNTTSSTRHCWPSMSMNGCYGGSTATDKSAVGVCETRTLASVSESEHAVIQLKLAVAALESQPPESTSGIIRLQVPIRQRRDALEWLQAQHQVSLSPSCFFSSRTLNQTSTILPLVTSKGVGRLLNDDDDDVDQALVSIAGVGSAVFFRGFDPFALHDWQSIRRFLSEDCPFIRAYGAMRFEGRTIIAPEWKGFGSFYFIVPQVEFNELQESSMLALTIAWDNNLLWTWQSAINELKDTLRQISPCIGRLRKLDTKSVALNFQHFPSQGSWDISVKRALEIINGTEEELMKVVLARCSKYITDTTTDPLVLLASLKVESQNCFQFYLQPPDSPAFIGNTPEQLFHRKCLHVTSEALAGTRARGVTKEEDLQIGRELLCSPKDNIEFVIVRESIRGKLEVICDDVIIQPCKALRKLPRIQHLSAQLSGRLRDKFCEFDILTSLHPSPAVCGLPMEDARRFINENETFDRGMYAGPVGWFGGSESEFAVGIRSALVGNGFGMLVYAGAGIVEGTNPSSEWEELDLKESQFTKLLQYEDTVACFQELKRTSTAK